MALCITFSLSTTAEEDGHHHEHSAHIHGAAILNFVAEDNTILIELETPAMNILGFEHAPKNEEQHKAVIQANELLKSYISILSIPDKQCKQSDSHLEFAHDAHEDEHHHDEGHHHDEHHHHDIESDSHSEYHLNYTINCESIENLKLDITLFENFPGFEHVDLNWIVDQKQGIIELGPKNTLVEF